MNGAWISPGGQRLDTEVAQQAGVSRAAAQKWIESGLVAVNGAQRPKIIRHSRATW